MANEQPNDVITFGDISTQISLWYDGMKLTVVEQLERAVQKQAKHVGPGRGPSAEFTLKVTFEKNGDDVHIKAALDDKQKNMPAFKMKAYVDKHGRLVQEDPNQIPLPLEGVTVTATRNQA